MSFLRRSKDKKIKTVRGESTLKLHEKRDERRGKQEGPKEARPATIGRKKMSLKGQVTLLEEKLNTAETRSTPPRHIEVIRRLSSAYLRLGEEDFSYYPKAENLYKQFNVLYPLHMEKEDWLRWIKASAKARLIREARNLLAEARLLYPGDEDLDRIETEVLHIGSAGTTEES